MTDVHIKKEVKGPGALGPIIAGVAGVVAGGLAVAAAVALSDKDNQKKVKGALVGAKEKVTDYIDSIQSQPVIEKGSKKLGEVTGDIKDKIAEKDK